MPRTTKNSAHGNNSLSQEDTEVPSSQEDISSSDQEPDQEISFHPSKAQQAIPNMFMPYIEGPKMDCTVNDPLYHKFLKWWLKCENILECELAALPKQQKCKKVIAWISDFGMDQYVSCCLSAEELNLDTIWGKFVEFCKPQLNEVRVQFDLLTSFRQGSRSVDEWYNAVQAQDNLTKYPQKQARFYIMIYFGSSCMMKSLYPRP